MSDRKIPASNFMATIAANVDNKNLDNEQFREFIRNSLPIVIYEDTEEKPQKEKINSNKVGEVIISFLKTSDDFEKIFEIEQFLNNDVALQVYQRFSLGLRVHL